MRCVDRISFSCSCDSAHVPEPYVNVGVMTMLNTRSLCRRRKYLDVNSCLYLENDAHAGLILLYISVVSCCSNVMVCPKYFACLLDLWLVRFFPDGSSPLHFRCSFRSLPSLFSAGPVMWKMKASRQEISSWTGNQFSGHLN